MEKISAVIICKDEEKNIQRCLKSIDFVDEIVIVDSGSRDRTVEICKKFTNKVFFYPWVGYIEQKNYALAKATHEWMLSLDADEVVSAKLKKSILNALQNHRGEYNGYRLNRHVFYLGRWINHCWYPEYKIRLFRKSKGRWVGKKLHERVKLDGKCCNLSGDLNHYTYQNISQHLRTIDSFSSIAAKEKFEEGKSVHLLNFFLNPVYQFFKLYILKRGFLDGMPGFIISVLSSYYTFLKYAKLWEIRGEGL